MLPFTAEQVLDVFRAYNHGVWPAQVLLTLAAIAGIALVRLGRGDRVVSALLALLWLWMAMAYHADFFTRINPAAWAFAAMFAAAAALFAWLGVARGGLRFGWSGPRARLGKALLLAAVLLYPVAAYLAGHRYPAAPTFGAPCPTTIFTLGMLMLAVRPPRAVLVAPLAWAAIGSTATLQLGMIEDFLLLAAGIAVATALLAGAAKQASRA